MVRGSTGEEVDPIVEFSVVQYPTMEFPMEQVTTAGVSKMQIAMAQFVVV